MDFGGAGELSAGEVGVVGKKDTEKARFEFDFRDFLGRIEKGDILFGVVNFGGCKAFQWCIAENLNASQQELNIDIFSVGFEIAFVWRFSCIMLNGVVDFFIIDGVFAVFFCDRVLSVRISNAFAKSACRPRYKRVLSIRSRIIFTYPACLAGNFATGRWRHEFAPSSRAGER